MQSSKVLRNSLFLLLARGAAPAFSLIYLPFLTRYLGRDGYGQYTFTYSFIAMFQILAWLGIHRILLREVARSTDEAEKYYGNALSLKMVLSPLALVVMAGVALTRTDLDLQSRQVMFVAIAETLIRIFGTVNVSLLRAFELMQHEFALALVQQITSTVSVFAAMFLDLGLIGVMVAFLIGAVAYAVVGFVLVRRVIGPLCLKLDVAQWMFLLREGLPVGGAVGMRRVYESQGTVHLRSAQDVGQAGVYGGGLRIYQFITLIPAAIANALFPGLSRRAVGERLGLASTVETNLKLLIIVAGAIGLPLFLTANLIIPLLLGPELADVALVVQILSPALAFGFAAAFSDSLLVSANLQWLSAVAWGVILALNLALNVVLAPDFGYVGAAVAFSVTELVFAALTLWFAWARAARFSWLPSVVKPLAAVFLPWAVAALLVPKLGASAAFAALPLFAVLIWGLRVFTQDEIGAMRRALSQLVSRQA